MLFSFRDFLSPLSCLLRELNGSRRFASEEAAAKHTEMFVGYLIALMLKTINRVSLESGAGVSYYSIGISHIEKHDREA